MSYSARSKAFPRRLGGSDFRGCGGCKQSYFDMALNSPTTAFADRPGPLAISRQWLTWLVNHRPFSFADNLFDRMKLLARSRHDRPSSNISITRGR
jgi:hypothetical protein